MVVVAVVVVVVLVVVAAAVAAVAADVSIALSSALKVVMPPAGSLLQSPVFCFSPTRVPLVTF